MEIIGQVKKWVHSKGLHNQDPRIQMSKVAEEFGEITEAINKNMEEEQVCEIGDFIVTLICISEQNGIDAGKCYIDSLSLHLEEMVNNPKFLINNMLISIGEIALFLEIQGIMKKKLQRSITEMFAKIARLSESVGTEFEICLNTAYEKISRRKGKLIDGILVKEEDLI